jgi:hypothetical protein
VGIDTVQFIQQLDIGGFDKKPIVAVVELQPGQVRGRTVGENDQVQIGDTVGFQIVAQGLVIGRQTQPKDHVGLPQLFDHLNDVGIRKKFRIQDRQGPGRMDVVEIARVEDLGWVIGQYGQSGTDASRDHAVSPAMTVLVFDERRLSAKRYGAAQVRRFFFGIHAE